MGATDDALVKIFVELTDEPFGNEAFWAKPLGGDRYELRNSPWYAYDLHYGDVVTAGPDMPDEKPRIVAVIQASGHKTLRVLFQTDVSEDERLKMLRSLHRWRAFHEHASNAFYTVDVEPEGDYQAVCNQLWQWEQIGLLEYETGTRAGSPA